MAISTSPDVSGVKVSISAVTNGTPSGSPVVLGHITSFGNLTDKSRNETKYTPVNDTQYDEIISLGSLTQNAFSMSVLYDIEASEGINMLEESIDNKEQVQIIIELNNSGGTNGTIIKQMIKCSSFTVAGEQDGKYIASFNASKIGLPVKTASA